MTSIPAFKDLLQRHERLCDEAEHVMGQDPLAQTYKILPLCRAIVTVLDERVLDNILSAIRGQSILRPTSLKVFGDVQNILMIRTMKEQALSAPIDFTPIAEHAWGYIINDVHHKSDIDAASQAIRVPLNVAIDFLCGIQVREQQALPGLHEHLTNKMDNSRNPHLTRRNARPDESAKFLMTEEKFLVEPYRPNTYFQAGYQGNSPWVRDAKERARNSLWGVGDWNNLENILD